jgi:hypothetical protein
MDRIDQLIDVMKRFGYAARELRELGFDPVEVWQIIDESDKQQAPPRADYRSAVGLEPGWENQLVLGTSRFHDYKWYQMQNGEVGGGRHKWLLWCRDHAYLGHPLDGAVFQNRVRECLKAYGS